MDKRRQMALVQRRRDELSKALRKGLERFKQMGIRADVYVPDFKDNTAFLLIDEKSLGGYFQRRILSKLKKIGSDISVKSGIEDDVLITKIVSKAEVNKESLNKDVSRVKEEMEKIKIKTEIFVNCEDYTTILILMDMTDISNYFDRVVKETIKRNRIKVMCDVYRESNVMVVRFVR